MSDYKKLENQPLKFVLAEFRFSPVMQISEYIPKIQEELRRQYPIPQTRTGQYIQVQPEGIAVSNLTEWTFISPDKKSAIDINQERLLYCTASYNRFGGFSDSCKFALDVLAKIVEPNLIYRIGLRYGDLVSLEGQKIEDLVDEHFDYPNCSSDIGTPQQQSTHSVILTSMGTLLMRTLYGNHALTTLPDVQGLPISIEPDTTPSDRIILDFDHIWEDKEQSVIFETSDILSKLEKLHETSREAFWKVTSDYARNEKWS